MKKIFAIAVLLATMVGCVPSRNDVSEVHREKPGLVYGKKIGLTSHGGYIYRIEYDGHTYLYAYGDLEHSASCECGWISKHAE